MRTSNHIMMVDVSLRRRHEIFHFEVILLSHRLIFNEYAPFYRNRYISHLLHLSFHTRSLHLRSCFCAAGAKFCLLNSQNFYLSKNRAISFSLFHMAIFECQWRQELYRPEGLLCWIRSSVMSARGTRMSIRELSASASRLLNISATGPPGAIGGPLYQSEGRLPLSEGIIYRPRTRGPSVTASWLLAPTGVLVRGPPMPVRGPPVRPEGLCRLEGLLF